MHLLGEKAWKEEIKNALECDKKNDSKMRR
jgi:hypothetical protein